MTGARLKHHPKRKETSGLRYATHSRQLIHGAVFGYVLEESQKHQATRCCIKKSLEKRAANPAEGRSAGSSCNGLHPVFFWPFKHLLFALQNFRLLKLENLPRRPRRFASTKQTAGKSRFEHYFTALPPLTSFHSG